MQPGFRIPGALAVLLLAVTGTNPARADGPETKDREAAAGAPSTRTVIGRGLAFLESDAVKWRKERKCATCHHGTMTVWALGEARSRGWPVDNGSFRELASWTTERLANIDAPRDPKSTSNMLNTPAAYLGMMAVATPKQDAVSPDDLKRITGHLLGHQEADGSWSWASAPLQNRPPPVFESDEVATLLGYIDLGPQVPSDPDQPSPARESRARAAAWLEKQKPGESTQVRALRLYREVRAGRASKDLEPAITSLLSLQRENGGWGQDKGLASDAYATGQALYFLALAGVPSERKEIRSAVTFLTTTQKDDGSWPVSSRAHPGATPMKNPAPIIHFGTAWATMGLMRSLPDSQKTASVERR